MLRNRLIPLCGIVFVALVVASSLILNPPGSNASAGKVLAYYQAHQHGASASALLTGLGVIFALLFFGYLRDYMRQDRATRWLATTAFGGVVLFAAGGAISAGSYLALGDQPRVLNAAAAQTLNLIQTDVSGSFTQAGLAVFFLATGAAILRGRLMPVWLGWASLVLGLLAASLILAFIAFLATGLWVIVVAIMLWTKAARESTEQESTASSKEYAGQS
jgi:hypothetical protein